MSAEEPTPGGVRDTVRRLRADYEAAKVSAGAYFGERSPTRSAETSSLGARELLAAALLSVLQAEATQFAVVFSVAWLFGLGGPASGARLTTAARLALSSRHASRVARLLWEARGFTVATRAMRASTAPLEYAREAAARPLAVIACTVFTARAMERSLLSRIAGCPASAVCDALGLAEAAAGLGGRISAGGLAAMESLAGAERAARRLSPLRLLLAATELDARAAALAISVWRWSQPPLLLLVGALTQLRRLIFV